MSEIKLSTGVVLKVKRISEMVIMAIKEDIYKRRPKVPIVHIDEDDRDEANPNDPEYAEALKAWESELTLNLYDAMVVQGTEVLSTPEGFPKPEDQDWQDDLLISHISVPTEGRGWRKARYLAWVRYVAAIGPDDMRAIILAGQRAAGLSEVDVAKAAETFRGAAERPTD